MPGFNPRAGEAASPRGGAFLHRRDDAAALPNRDDPSMEPWKPYHVRVGDLDLRVAHRGEGHTPLLLLTGIGAHLDMWAPLERQLNGRELIAFDAPGTGESTRTSRPLRMGGLARIVRDLLDVLGQDQVDVLGVSFGGALAQQLAKDHPDRVRRLVLCGTSAGFVGVPPKPLPALFLMSPARYYHPALFRFMLPRIVGGRTARDPAVLAAQAGPRLSRPPDPIGYAYQIYATSGWTSIHWLHKLRQPALVLAGDDDRAIPLPNARLLARRIPDARLHVVKDGGHLFVLDEPENVTGVIQDFLDA
jgi:poly(3-hydroxyalkanoate) depolymerase